MDTPPVTPQKCLPLDPLYGYAVYQYTVDHVSKITSNSFWRMKNPANKISLLARRDEDEDGLHNL